MHIILITYNVNSIYAPNRLQTIKDLVINYLPDVICIQETKTDDIPNLNQYPYSISNTKKGVSGVVIYSKLKLVPRPIPIKFKGRLAIGVGKEYVIINLYAHYGKATKELTHTQVTGLKINLYRYVYRTIKKMSIFNPK